MTRIIAQRDKPSLLPQEMLVRPGLKLQCCRCGWSSGEIYFIYKQDYRSREGSIILREDPDALVLTYIGLDIFYGDNGRGRYNGTISLVVDFLRDLAGALHKKQLIISRTANYGLMRMVYEKITNLAVYRVKTSEYSELTLDTYPDLLNITNKISVEYQTSPKDMLCKWLIFTKQAGEWQPEESGFALQIDDRHRLKLLYTYEEQTIHYQRAQFYLEHNFDVLIPARP